MITMQAWTSRAQPHCYTSPPSPQLPRVYLLMYSFLPPPHICSLTNHILNSVARTVRKVQSGVRICSCTLVTRTLTRSHTQLALTLTYSHACCVRGPWRHSTMSKGEELDDRYMGITVSARVFCEQYSCEGTVRFVGLHQTKVRVVVRACTCCWPYASTARRQRSTRHGSGRTRKSS